MGGKAHPFLSSRCQVLQGSQCFTLGQADVEIAKRRVQAQPATECITRLCSCKAALQSVAAKQHCEAALRSTA